MKTDSRGKVKLEKGEIRIGNFFFKEEKYHIKIQDISSMITHRVMKTVAVGLWLKNMLERGEEGYESLSTYAATLFTVSLVAPDQEFVGEALEMANRHMSRHPDWYGFTAAPSESDDAEALNDVKEMVEAGEASAGGGVTDGK